MTDPITRLKSVHHIMKHKDLQDFVLNRYPKIISGSKFNLGKLTYDRNWNLDDPEVVNLVENLITYALIRDEYRAVVKKIKS